MAQVLFAVELRAHSTHLEQLLVAAEQLRALGHSATFVLGDVTRADEIVGRHGFDYLQAPVWRSREPRAALAPCNYAEILQHHGYADREGLLGMVKAWREIYRLVDPQVILFKHAPTALLACRGLEAVRVLYGVGFSLPPREHPFPNFRTWESVPRERLERSDAQVLDAMNWVLKKLRLRPLDAAHELFDVDEEFLCTFAELDHYIARSGASYCGPVFDRGDGAQPRWPEDGAKRVYVHLAPGQRAFGAVAEMLSDAGHSVLWFAPGIREETLREFEKPSFSFVRERVRLSVLTDRVDAAIIEGSHSPVAAALLAGVPLALFPLGIEQALLARRVALLGAGTLAAPQAPVEEMRRAVISALEEKRHADGARAFATRYRDHAPQQALARISARLAAHCKTAMV